MPPPIASMLNRRNQITSSRSAVSAVGCDDGVSRPYQKGGRGGVVLEGQGAATGAPAEGLVGDPRVGGEAVALPSIAVEDSTGAPGGKRFAAAGALSVERTPCTPPMV